MLCRDRGIRTAQVFIVTLDGEQKGPTATSSGVFSRGSTEQAVTGCPLAIGSKAYGLNRSSVREPTIPIPALCGGAAPMRRSGGHG